MKALFIIPSLILLGSLSAYAAPDCVTSGGVLSIITIDNVEYKTACCSGLDVEMVGNDEVCFKKDDSPTDPTLQSCSSNNDCSNGMGCFLQEAEDLFSGETNSEAEDSAQMQSQVAMDTKIEQILGEDGEEKANGQGCTYHAECESYNCAPKKNGSRYVKTCSDKNICRLAKENEVAVNPVQCEAGLTKDNTNTCKSDNDGVYVGLLGDVEVQVDSNDQCKMSIPEEAQNAGQAAMRALRSMEFLFAKETAADHEDCLRKINPILKNRIGKILFEARKQVVKEFNTTWALIKQDYQTIMAAQAADATSTTSVQLHGVATTEGEIKSRTASGFDMLIMMKRRNIIFQDYEKKMRDIVQKAANDVKAMEEAIAGLDQNSRSWTLRTSTESFSYRKGDVKCRDSGIGLGIATGKRRKVKDRWAQHYRVQGNAADNLSVQGNTLFINSLAAMAEGNKSAAINDLSQRRYYMMDPLIPGNKQFESYGSGYGFLTYSGIYRQLSGGNNSSLKAIRKDLPASIINYLKDMNPENKSEFLYEPELVFITDGEVNKKEEIATCLQSVEALAKPECQKLNAYVQDVADITLAQTWAFSRTNGKHYKNYFHEKTSWRRRLFAYYSTNYTNLVTYYNTLAVYRAKQNACIDERLGLVSQTMMTGGYAAGLANNYWDPDKYLTNLNGSTPKAAAQTKSSLSVNHNFSNFSGATNSLKDGGALKDNIASGTGSSTSSASVSGTADAKFAANLNRMKEANSKNMSSTELASKTKDVMESMRAVSKGSGAGTSGSAASLNGSNRNGSSAMGNANGAGTAALGNDLKGEADKNASGKDKTAGSGVAAGSGAGVAGAAAAGAGAGFGGLGGITSGSSSGMGSADASASGSDQDPTGMSDEEKERLMANYERTKSQYNPNENDSLFKVVSKAYVRNLDKVLTKKKKTLDSTSTGAK